MISLRCYGAGARRATLWNAWRLRSAAIAFWSAIPRALGRPFWSSRGMNGTRSLLACTGGASLAASSGMLVRVSGLVAQVISGVHAWGRDPMVLLGQDSRRVWEGDLDGEDRHG